MSEVVILDEHDRAAILSAMSLVGREYGEDDFYQFFYQCSRMNGMLPTRLSKALFDFRMGRSGSVLLIKGLLTQQHVPPTPALRGNTWNKTTLAARKIMCIALSQLGHIYNFLGKKDFDYIDDVFPIYRDRNEQLGSNCDFLEWHVEDGFHPAKADLAALFCLRGDAAVQTHICKAQDLDLDANFRAELMKKNFLIQVDPTFQPGSGAEGQFRCAVLSEGEDPEIIYDPAYMIGATPEAQAALKHVHDCIQAAYQSITLEPGDLLVFDNRRVMHARSAYQPAYDGSDRWLLRSLLLESYWKTRECLDQLALTPDSVAWPPPRSTSTIAQINGRKGAENERFIQQEAVSDHASQRSEV
ncbi:MULTISPECIES: TauD/TfdA family dioxygenase [unclassified Janthinobacterium]|uniref:TauD/TfdA family dioxygenase n=1 Tax=unclassified Janthinobacterium TaxID=2610881 RepID=UPI0013052821|nr:MULTISPECIES: TauD/TfdA family dioxygenase [unclassified Janthinobacterium]MDZ5637350.1 TauD/TfdA family dioxygenase [Janthinobacterium sp. GMG1]